jgi:hypothetical protein
MPPSPPWSAGLLIYDTRCLFVEERRRLKIIPNAQRGNGIQLRVSGFAPTAKRSRVHPGRHGAVAPGQLLGPASDRAGTQPGACRHEALRRIAP